MSTVLGVFIMSALQHLSFRFFLVNKQSNNYMVYTVEGRKGGVLIIILIAILEKFTHHMCFKLYFAYH